MDLLKFLWSQEQKDFFEKYKDCAEEAVLGKIWYTKESNATLLRISDSQVSDLMSLKDWVNLQVE